MTSQANFGLIGCGIWGDVLARSFSASPHARLTAVCDQNEDRAEEYGRRFGVERRYTDWRELLMQADLEAVSVATPDDAHTEIVVAALEAGKHVLVEKPLAKTVHDCRKILAARDAAGKKLMVDFHNRWNIPFVHVRRMVESGELGEVQMMNLRLNDTIFVPTQLLSWASRSSPLHFLGSHLIDLVRWISGAEVERVFTVSRQGLLQNQGIDTPDFHQSILELSSGASAVLENCWILPENSPHLFEFKAEFVGTDGSTSVNATHHRMIEKYTGQGAALLDVLGAIDVHGMLLGFCRDSIDHFIDSVVHDTPLIVTGEDGLMATRVIEAMEKSARTGQPVELNARD